MNLLFDNGLTNIDISHNSDLVPPGNECFNFPKCDSSDVTCIFDETFTACTPYQECAAVNRNKYWKRVTCMALDHCTLVGDTCYNNTDSCEDVNILPKLRHRSRQCKTQNCIYIDRSCNDKPPTCEAVSDFFFDDDIPKACRQIDGCKFANSECAEVPQPLACDDVNSFVDGIKNKKQVCTSTQGCIFSRGMCKTYPVTCAEADDLDIIRRRQVCSTIQDCHMINDNLCTEDEFSCEKKIFGLGRQKAEKECGKHGSEGCMYFQTNLKDFTCTKVTDLNGDVECNKINEQPLRRFKKNNCKKTNDCFYDVSGVNAEEGICFKVDSCNDYNNIGQIDRRKRKCNNNRYNDEMICAFNDVSKTCSYVCRGLGC